MLRTYDIILTDYDSNFPFKVREEKQTVTHELIYPIIIASAQTNKSVQSSFYSYTVGVHESKIMCLLHKQVKKVCS